MITQRDDPHIDSETTEPDESESSEPQPRWPRLRWYADAVRAELRDPNRPPARAESDIDFLSLFLNRALAGHRRSNSRA